MENDKLTEHQDMVLKIIEKEFFDKWFQLSELPEAVTRPDYICRILQKKGHLKMKTDFKKSDGGFEIKTFF